MVHHLKDNKEVTQVGQLGLQVAAMELHQEEEAQMGMGLFYLLNSPPLCHLYFFKKIFFTTKSTIF